MKRVGLVVVVACVAAGSLGAAAYAGEYEDEVRKKCELTASALEVIRQEVKAFRQQATATSFDRLIAAYGSEIAQALEKAEADRKDLDAQLRGYIGSLEDATYLIQKCARQ